MGHIVVIIAVEDQQISRNVQCVAVCCSVLQCVVEDKQLSHNVRCSRPTALKPGLPLVAGKENVL